jgi:nitrate reductase gamma subunit
MSGFVNDLLFGIYPYVCLAVFLLGSLVRFDREQYTWKSDSSQLLRRGQLRWGSNLFHVGLILLVHRRIAIARIRATSTRMDIFILLWILATLLLGLTTILFSARHPDGSMMILLSEWAQHIVTFRGGAAAFVAGVPLVYKIHLFFGLTLFFLFPFSRLVHVWSGFASIAYLGRAYQIVRSRG